MRCGDIDDTPSIEYLTDVVDGELMREVDGKGGWERCVGEVDGKGKL